MYRTEYPRPQFERNEWQCLNGTWSFEFDDENCGYQEKWYETKQNYSKQIEVPFVYQSQKSGIKETDFHDYVWYKRKMSIPNEWKENKIILHFGAVDYFCKIFVNGKFVGEHVGGHTSFSVDITNYVNFEEDELVVYVHDPGRDERIPRGKQYWKPESAAIWYTRTTGIWQSVWLEPVSSEANIENVKFTSLFDEGQVAFDYNFSGNIVGKKIRTSIFFKGELLVDEVTFIKEESLKKTYYLFNNQIDRSDFHGNGWTWRPETPNLFDVEFELISEQDVLLDKVSSYFGIRKVHTEGGMIYLNNRPFYQKLVLDQGYWTDSLMTAVTDEDFKRDIELAKEMGFNGCRKHQKVEDPRFLYWADKLGFIVWGECASPSVYSSFGVTHLTNEWFEIIERDYNHPSILTWVPINESWGVPEISVDKQQQHYSAAMYHLIHSLDKTRLVISNDGWEMTKTDICAIHNYQHGNASEETKYQEFVSVLSDKEKILSPIHNNRNVYCEGFEYQGEPFLLTEFGGIGYDKENKGWGYTKVSSEDAFIEEYQRIMAAVYQSHILHGYCYTQLTDVEQEKNGLLTPDRKPKVSLEKIKEINEQWHLNVVY